MPPIEFQHNTRWENVDGKAGFPVTVNILDSDPQVGTKYPTFFTAYEAVRILYMALTYETASSSGAIDIKILTSSDSKGGGTTILKSTFDTSATARIMQTKTANDLTKSLVQPGERLDMQSSGSLANLTHVQMVFWFKHVGRGDYR